MFPHGNEISRLFKTKLHWINKINDKNLLAGFIFYKFSSFRVREREKLKKKLDVAHYREMLEDGVERGNYMVQLAMIIFDILCTYYYILITRTISGKIFVLPFQHAGNAFISGSPSRIQVSKREHYRYSSNHLVQSLNYKLGIFL